MSEIVVVDNDFLQKLAVIEQLQLLRLESNKIVVTDKNNDVFSLSYADFFDQDPNTGEYRYAV